MSVLAKGLRNGCTGLARSFQHRCSAKRGPRASSGTGSISVSYKGKLGLGSPLFTPAVPCPLTQLSSRNSEVSIAGTLPDATKGIPETPQGQTPEHHSGGCGNKSPPGWAQEEEPWGSRWNESPPSLHGLPMDTTETQSLQLQGSPLVHHRATQPCPQAGPAGKRCSVPLLLSARAVTQSISPKTMDRRYPTKFYLSWEILLEWSET